VTQSPCIKYEGLPPLTRERRRACAAINISILHKFEKAKHKRFGSVGRYANECVLAAIISVIGRVRKLAILAKVRLNTQNILGVYYGY